MDEQKTQTQEKPAETAGNIGERDKYETTPVIERANETAQRLEKANQERKELLDREESILAKKRLGGYTEAGEGKAEEQEESPADYTQRVMSGQLKNDKGKA